MYFENFATSKNTILHRMLQSGTQNGWMVVLNNVTRMTYSFQDEPRSYGGAADFPTIDILDGGAVYARIGPDIFSPGQSCKLELLCC